MSQTVGAAQTAGQTHWHPEDPLCLSVSVLKQVFIWLKICSWLHMTIFRTSSLLYYMNLLILMGHREINKWGTDRELSLTVYFICSSKTIADLHKQQLPGQRRTHRDTQGSSQHVSTTVCAAHTHACGVLASLWFLPLILLQVCVVELQCFYAFVWNLFIVNSGKWFSSVCHCAHLIICILVAVITHIPVSEH